MCSRYTGSHNILFCKRFSLIYFCLTCTSTSIGRHNRQNRQIYIKIIFCSYNYLIFSTNVQRLILLNFCVERIVSIYACTCHLICLYFFDRFKFNSECITSLPKINEILSLITLNVLFIETHFNYNGNSRQLYLISTTFGERPRYRGVQSLNINK